ncbi:MFS transporter [Flavimarina sp. Hel_I_48]|uniref:MFS transporter n=1 Tax=Flavimarina sp. Hel_I_48 TaxID=1392488 RepID=UPI0004DF185E|nr:MFS transporter [Flavimarina sp. Hel_I_48]
MVKVFKQTKRYHKIRNGIFLSGISVFAQLYLFQPLLPALCSAFNVTVAMSSLVISAGTVGMAVGLFILAFRADAIERKKLMVFSLLISAFLTVFSAFSPSFLILVLLCFFKGMVLSGVSAVALAYLSEEIRPAILGVAISIYLSGNTLGGMLGRVSAGLMEGWLGWRLTTMIIGIFTLFLGIIFTKYLPKSANFEPKKAVFSQKLALMGSFLKQPVLLSLFLIAMLSMGTFISVYNYLDFHLAEPPFSLPHYVIALIFIMYLAGIAGSLMTGKWSDRKNLTWVLQMVLLLFLLGLAGLFSQHLWLLILGLGILTFGFFGTHTMASRLVSTYAPEGKSSAVSLYWLFYYIGSSVLGSLTGMIISASNWYVFVIVLMILIAIAFLFAFSIKKNLTSIS